MTGHSIGALRVLLATAEEEVRQLREALALAEATPPAPSALDIGPDQQRHAVHAAGMDPRPVGHLDHWQHL